MFLFNLFKKKPAVVKQIIRGFTIILPKEVAESLEDKNLYLSITCNKGKPSCVQVNKTMNGKKTYICTLKKYMGVQDFKNGNICDFSPNNVIYF